MVFLRFLPTLSIHWVSSVCDSEHSDTDGRGGGKGERTVAYGGRKGGKGGGWGQKHGRL